MNYYSVLGILPTATSEEVKRAYRKCAAEHHPDRNIGKSDTADKFKNASEAYEILSDPIKRQSYDKMRNSQILSDPLVTASEIWADFLKPLIKL